MKISRWLTKPMIGALGAVLAAVGWYAWRIEPRWLAITRLTLPVLDLPSTFDGYRIVHLSDPHLGVRLTQSYLPLIVQAVNRERPDLIAITGDFATPHRDGLADGGTILAGLRARDGVWAVLGNHDYHYGADRVVPVLSGAEIGLLCNRHHVIWRGADRLVIAGVDDVIWGAPRLRTALDGVPDGSPVILLVHEPDFARTAATDPRIVLQLSGHTHGGQIRLPGLRPLYVPAWGSRYTEGAYWIRAMRLYVTRGIGTGWFVMRFHCRPEIAVITLARRQCPT